MILARKVVQEVDLTDAGWSAMVEGLVGSARIELFRLYCQEPAKSVIAPDPHQEIGAAPRLLWSGRVVDPEGVGVLKVQHVKDEEIGQRFLAQTRTEEVGAGESAPSVGGYPGCRGHGRDRAVSDRRLVARAGMCRNPGSVPESGVSTEVGCRGRDDGSGRPTAVVLGRSAEAS